MQFKHPEFLYALLALIIPILVHLFQLRRFQKVYFSNVTFLKTITTQTRRSSQLKKWLTLLTRILILACIIIAFAQPYIAPSTYTKQKSELVIYLDNSFSMQARGTKGPLLKRAIQELITAVPKDQNIAFFTNTSTYPEGTLHNLKNDLLQLEYSPIQLPYETVYLKAKQLLSKESNRQKKIIMISDFQQKEKQISIPETDTTTTVHLVQLAPVTAKNVAIDSLGIQYNDTDELVLHVALKNYGDTEVTVPIAYYDDTILIGKTTMTIPPNSEHNTTFTIGKYRSLQGRVVIEDPNLSFDNTHYFSLNTPEKIKVVSINGTDNTFINKIYTPDEFTVTNSTINTLNYTNITTANLVVLNEVEQLPISLLNTLDNYRNQGGVICFIPAVQGELSSYNLLFTNLNTTYTALLSQEKKITTINFSDPLFQGVFESTVQNFQYPKVNAYYPITTDSTPILAFENGNAFLFRAQSLYAFTAPINTANSNFQNSPLIVPTLYTIGKQSLALPEISYTIGKVNTYDVMATTGEDGILSLHLNDERCIPLQQRFTTKVKITTEDTPSKAGSYAVKNKENSVQYVSYNYASEESNTSYTTLSKNESAYKTATSVDALFQDLKEANSLHELWKWFIIFALLFLGIEILLLNYLK